MRLPDAPPPPFPLPPITPGQVGVFAYIHGDGRHPANSSADAERGFRLRNWVEIDFCDTCGYTHRADNGTSMRQVRFFNKVIESHSAKAAFSDVTKAERQSDGSVQVELTMSGGVPWTVAGPVPNIDYTYLIVLRQKSDGWVTWWVKAKHDGFPGHEFFIEAGGSVKFSDHYAPTFFNPISTGTATPSYEQAAKGGAALGGLYMVQSWTRAGGFKVGR